MYNESALELNVLIAKALAIADALNLWDVSIGLDRARLHAERLTNAKATKIDFLEFSGSTGQRDVLA